MLYLLLTEGLDSCGNVKQKHSRTFDGNKVVSICETTIDFHFQVVISLTLRFQFIVTSL